MTSRHLFPLRIISDMKGKTTQVVHEENNGYKGAQFKEECKEDDKHYVKKENNLTEIQATFLWEVQDES